MRLFTMMLIVLAAVPGTGLALAPHELAVIVNAESAASSETGFRYARLREIPRENVVSVRVPLGEDGRATPDLAADAFVSKIWRPATNALAERGVAPHIRAWVYSVDFPYRVRCERGMSITGLTALQGRVPSGSEIYRAVPRSPFFAGPSRPEGPQEPSASFAALRELHSLSGDFTPAMVLAVRGEAGLTHPHVQERLARDARLDASAPNGTFYFVTRDDVRSRARDWQFAPVADWVRARGLRAVLTNRMPEGVTDALGLMCGVAHVDAPAFGRFVPGAVADHLTSYAGDFAGRSQSHLTEWLRAGASSSSGAVTEPFAIWLKFPHARFYEHYLSGCTLIESYYQSVASPVQLLLVGDPLLAPWRPSDRLSWVRRPPRRASEPFEVEVAVQAVLPEAYRRFEVFVDGRPYAPPSDSGRIRIDPTTIGPGSHRLRVVATRSGLLRHSAHLVHVLEVSAR